MAAIWQPLLMTAALLCPASQAQGDAKAPKKDQGKSVRKAPAKTETTRSAKADTQRLIEQLGSADFDERMDAFRKLERRGKSILPTLREAIEESDDPELRWQGRKLIRKLEGGQAGRLSPSRRRGATKAGRARNYDRDHDSSRAQDRRSSSQSTSISVGPDGVRVEISVDGKKKRYSAKSMEELLKKHPELKGKVQGWSSSRRGKFPGFKGLEGFGIGEIDPDRMHERIRKQMEDVLRGLRGGVHGRGEDFPVGEDMRKHFEKLERELKKSQERMRRIFEKDGSLRDLFERKGGLEELLRKSGRRFDFDSDFDSDSRRSSERSSERSGKSAKAKSDAKASKGLERAKPRRGDVVVKRDDGPKLGVYLRGELPAPVREYLGLGRGVGIWVDEVTDGSLAERAGLAPGDIVVKIGGRKVGNASDVAKALRAAGEKVDIDFIRRGERKRKSVAKTATTRRKK